MSLRRCLSGQQFQRVMLRRVRRVHVVQDDAAGPQDVSALSQMIGQLQGQVACMQFNPQKGEPAGFFDLPAHDHCPDPQHNPTYGIYVPPGKGYRHVCPGCGFSFVIRGS